MSPNGSSQKMVLPCGCQVVFWKQDLAAKKSLVSKVGASCDSKGCYYFQKGA